jgi:hypothetical protein
MTVHGPVISTNTLQVQMGYLLDGELVENVYHVHKSTAWAIGDIGAIAAAFEGWETSSASALRSVDCELIRITVTDLTSLTAGRVDQQLVVPIVGATSSPALPNNVTFALKANIASRGKGRSGRTFWIGLAESQVVLSQILTATADAIQTALNDLLTDISSSVPGAALSVMHLFVNKVYQADAQTSPILTWTYTDLTTDSMKDRLPNHKRHKRST